MRAYLFIEKEVKIPTEGDWFMTPDGDMYQAGLYETELHPIFTRHEIKVPEGTENLVLSPVLYGKHLGNMSIPIPRPKKKVKKYIWETTIEHDKKAVVWRTLVPLSEEEMRKWHDFNCFQYHKILEIEVEE